jgi:hypothetical protein
VTVVSFVISGLFLAAMIGISLYGARTLPPDARIPLHYGLGSYNNFASKSAGLVVWPAGGAVLFAILAALAGHAFRPSHPHGSGTTPLIILPIALAVVAASQWGAIRLARNNTASPDQ